MNVVTLVALGVLTVSTANLALLGLLPRFPLPAAGKTVLGVYCAGMFLLGVDLALTILRGSDGPLFGFSTGQVSAAYLFFEAAGLWTFIIVMLAHYRRGGR